MNKIFLIRILSLLFFTCPALANTANNKDFHEPEAVHFPKGLGPVHFFETPTRYVIVDPTACGQAKLCGGKILYYQIDKKTNQPLVLAGGSTVNQGTGYAFIDPHSQKRYVLLKITRKSINSADEPGRFYITDEQNKVLVREETRFFSTDYI